MATNHNYVYQLSFLLNKEHNSSIHNLYKSTPKRLIICIKDKGINYLGKSWMITNKQKQTLVQEFIALCL
jgi:hypothetical protein